MCAKFHKNRTKTVREVAIWFEKVGQTDRHIKHWYCKLCRLQAAAELKSYKNACSTDQFIWIVVHDVTIDRLCRRFHKFRLQISREWSILTDKWSLYSRHIPTIQVTDLIFCGQKRLLEEKLAKSSLLTQGAEHKVLAPVALSILSTLQGAATWQIIFFFSYACHLP